MTQFGSFQITGMEEAKKLVSSALHKAALSKAVFNTAHDARKAAIDEMGRVLDRPTPYMTRGLIVRGQGLEVNIGFELFPVGKSPAEIIYPHVEGGGRSMKRSETYLRSYWTPGKGVKINQYGNIPGSLITQILSQLGKFPEVGYLANVTARSKKRKAGRIRNFFIVGPGNKGLHAGVWERLSGGRVKPILIFIDSPSYKKRFKFYEVVKRTIERNIQRRYDEALNEKTGGLLGR
jgi:hypothetical protein